ncbi:small ribosomal subunit protein eS12-like [Mirounga angustirostris]|uniref:40S ribosomal protein S12-like n=1 Tax=Mirounga leonina TaxID=9715 RepID=UPI00156C3733|nr:40S ribosomal protein S12-like [Mirounga leonina]XP_045735788.1 40S ribosomal protein S12-like [Mirounga angustirostris]
MIWHINILMYIKLENGFPRQRLGCVQDSAPSLAPAEGGPAAGGVVDINTALQEVRKTALIQDGLAPGIHKSCQSLRQGQAHLCVLASNCDEPVYVKLVEALCAEHQINLIKVDDNKKRGERGGLCGTDTGGEPPHPPPGQGLACSCVIVKDDGKESQARDVIEAYFKCKKRTN